MSNAKILCIDDCEVTLLIVKEYLQKEGFDIFAVSNIQAADEIMNSNQIDLIVLDLMMPDTDGMTVLRQYRATHGNIPVIMLSGRGDDIDKIIGIEAGADDYIAKPFQPRELSARIKAVLRRVQSDTANDYGQARVDKILLDKWIIDREQYQVFSKNGESADLTTGEYMVLEKLVLAKNKAQSRDSLFALLHDYDMDTSDRAVDIKITRIRSKLSDDSRDPRYIKTIRNVGYMFIGAVE